MQVLKHRGDRQEQMKLDAPVPHFHQRAFERAAAEQRRIGVEPLEIPADRDRLRNRRAVVEQERGEALHRVDGGIGVSAVLARRDVDLLHGNLDALLGEEYPHPPRIGRTAAVIELMVPTPRLARSLSR